MRTIIVVTLILVVLVVGALGGYFFLKERKTAFAEGRLEEAHALLEEGKTAEVVEVLRPIYDTVPRFDKIDEVIKTLAQCYEKSEIADATETTAAIHSLWQEIVDDHPQSQYATLAKLKLAQIIMDESPDRARAYFAEVMESGDTNLASLARSGEAQFLDREGKTDQAREIYLQIIQGDGDEEAKGVAYNRLSDMNHRMLYSPRLDEFCELVEIKKGDNPIKVAVKHHTSARFLLNINGLEETMLRPGQRVKVPKEGWRVIVCKGDLHLYLLTSSGKFVKRYSCGIGEIDYKTPVGKFKISNKLKEPTWYKPGGPAIPFGAEGHEIGTRWMSLFTLDNGRTGLGIHGTDKPDTVGQRKSAGCIRMLNPEVEELFTIILSGTLVEIVEDFNLTDYQKQIANEQASGEIPSETEAVGESEDGSSS